MFKFYFIFYSLAYNIEKSFKSCLVTSSLTGNDAKYIYYSKITNISHLRIFRKDSLKPLHVK